MPRAGWLAIGAMVGALVSRVDDPRAPAAVVALVGFALVAALAVGPGWRARMVAIAVGALAISIRTAVLPTAGAPAGGPDGSGPWRMAVESVGSPREGHQTGTLRSIAADGADGSAAFRLAATLPRYPEIEPGDVVQVEGRTRPRPDSPYGSYLARLGAWGTLDARSLSVIDRPTDPVTRLEHARRGTGDLLTRVLPEPEAGLAAGILIGLRDRVDRDVAAAFTTAGVSHVVAISGWNIAIVAAGVTAIAGGLGRRRRSVVTVVAIVAYIAFAGASPSVLRAGAMAGVVLFARESGRAGRAAAALCWAATLLLISDPSLIGDAGFQLSSLATAGLIAWATPLSERLDRWSGGRLPGWLAESLGVSLAAQLATLPVVLASFGRLSVIAPAVNLLVVPLVAPAMAAGLLAMAGGGLVALGMPDAVGSILAAPGWVALRLIIGIVDLAAAVPFASIAVEPAIGVGLGAGSAALIVAGTTWRPAKRSMASSTIPVPSPAVQPRPEQRQDRPMMLRLATIGLVIAIAVAGAVAVTRPAGVARISVLDVGQGDAILVEGSAGGRLLVDGGPDPDRLLVQLDRRIPPWDRRIDAVILSHPHEDHVAGLALLLARYHVGRVLEPGMRGPGPGYAAWLERLARPNAPPHLAIAAGDHLTVDEIAMRVLWPIRGEVPSEPPDNGTGINNVSVVLLGTVGEQRFLLAGDVEEEIDPRLLSERLPRLDFLKVAHHGSRTATTEPFVETVRPKVAVASAGAGNPYGHPARSTLDRLAAVGARVFRTDKDGTVTVAFDAAGMSVRSEPRSRADIGEPAIAARAVTRAAGPRPVIGCAIPLFAQRSVPDRSLASPAPTDDRSPATLGYHRDDADRRPDCTLDDRPAAVRLGRRRARRATARRSLRVRARPAARRAARALGSAGRPRDGPDGRGSPLRAARDTRDVRWRDAGGGQQPERTGPAQRHTGPRPRGDRPARRGECDRDRRGR
jgi:competence protein ComEC